jgi:hypothetical protein
VDVEVEVVVEVQAQELLNLASHVEKKAILLGIAPTSQKVRKLILLQCVRRRSSIVTSAEKRDITPETVLKLSLRKRLLPLKRKRKLHHAHLARRNLRPVTTAMERVISSAIAPKKPFLSQSVLLEVASVEADLVPLVRRNPLVLVSTVDKKAMATVTVLRRLLNSPKVQELVVVPVLDATEDVLSFVTDVEMETIWFVIALSPTLGRMPKKRRLRNPPLRQNEEDEATEPFLVRSC